MRSVQTSRGTPRVELLSVHLSVSYLNRWDRPPLNSALGNLTKKKKKISPFTFSAILVRLTSDHTVMFLVFNRYNHWSSVCEIVCDVL